jgi:hypothetical protein
MFLIEVYFSRAYNAGLLYHKQRFLSAWTEGSLPAFISLSVFAAASIFLKSDETAQNSATLTEGISCWLKLHPEWANRASQDALSQADIPSLETVQACQTLALYWLASGQTERVHVHVNVAYRVCRLLRIHQNTVESDDPTFAELNRRCLWASWMTQCISQENAVFKRQCWADVAGLPLPSDEMSYLTNKPISSHYIDSGGEVRLMSGFSTEAQTPVSILAESAKLVGLWYGSLTIPDLVITQLDESLRWP